MTAASDDGPGMNGSPTSPETAEGIDREGPQSPAVPDIPRFLDWILGGLVVLGGLLFALFGLFALVVPDRGELETAIAQDEVDIEGMTEAEFVEVTLSLFSWIGVGFLLTGLVMLILGIAYVVHRRRVHDRAEAGEPTSDFIAHALLGAIVSAILSFIPLSPIIGGGLAGYLERGDSERTISVGAASAVVLIAPLLAVGVSVGGGIAAGFSAIGEGGVGAIAALAIIVGLVFVLGFTAALGAVGGWIGGKIAVR